MTALRVITDHSELDRSGQVTHASIDAHINTTPFVIVSGVAGSIPPSARKLIAGPGIIITDGGAGGNITITAPGGGGGSGGTVVSWMEIPFGDVDGENTDFVLTNTPSPSTALMFYVNGVLQTQGSDFDYEMPTPQVVRLLHPYMSGSNITATYPYVTLITGSSVGTSWMETPSGSFDGVNLDFTLLHVPSPANSLMFYMNGVLQMQGLDYDYVLSGSTVHLNYAYMSGSNASATYPY